MWYRNSQSLCLLFCKVFLEPRLRLQLSVKGGDSDPERIARSAWPSSLSHLVRSADDVLQGANFHQQPPHNGVVAMAGHQ